MSNSEHKGFPKVHSKGKLKKSGLYYIILEKLGPSLKD
jgi:hypothetical protein